MKIHVEMVEVLKKCTLFLSLAEDAREAVKHGVSGILVSNHGGRSLDGVPATVGVTIIHICFLIFRTGVLSTYQ